MAKRKRLNEVVATDHNTIKGEIEALKINEDKNFQMLAGAEIKTECGDIMGLFLNGEIENRKFEEVVDEIKSQARLIVLAHPYRQYKLPEKLINRVDLIEGFNARLRKMGNEKAYEFAMKFKKPMTAESDAHKF